jgi:hypothetical protein
MDNQHIKNTIDLIRMRQQAIKDYKRTIALDLKIVAKLCSKFKIGDYLKEITDDGTNIPTWTIQVTGFNGRLCKKGIKIYVICKVRKKDGTALWIETYPENEMEVETRIQRKVE